MSIMSWIVNAIGATIMLSIFILMGAMVIMRIKENKNELNTIPKLLKASGKVVWSYILYIGMSAILLLIVWVITSPPYPYNAFIGCFILGVIVGMIYMVNKK